MQKTKILSFCVLLAAAIGYGLGGTVRNTDGCYIAEAERAKTTAISDEFNSAALDGAVWQTSDADKGGVKDYGGAFVFRDSDYSHAINWMGYSTKGDGSDGITKSYSLEFVMARESASGAWTSCYLGLESPDLKANTITPTSGGTRGYMIAMNNGGATLYTGNNAFSTENIPMGLTADGTRYAIKFDVTVNAGSSDTIAVYCVKAPSEDGEIDYGESKGTITGNDKVGELDLRGYFGFGSLMGKTEKTVLSKIKLTEGETVWTPKDDLKTPAIDHIYGSQPADVTKDFRCWNSYKDAFAEKYTNGPIGTLKICDGAEVYSVDEVEMDKSLISFAEISFKMNIIEAGSGCKAVIGKRNSAATEIVFEKTEGTVSARLGDSTLELGEVSGENRYKIVIKSTDIEIYLNGANKGTLIGASSFDGKIGFAAADSADIEIDDVSVVSYKNRNSSESDMSIDFTVKNSRGNTYLDSDEWYTAGNALLTRYDEISFVNAGPDAVFSSRKAYSDYVFKFDLYDIGQGEGGCSWIGISFAKPSYDGNWTTAPTILLSPRDSGENIYTNIETQSGAAFTTGGNIKSDHNIFMDMGGESAHKKLNVVLEVTGRTVKLYFKYDDEPESMLSEPKAVIADIDTYGFVGLNCNYGGNFALSNVSLRNLNADRNFIPQYGDKVKEEDRLTGISGLGL